MLRSEIEAKLSRLPVEYDLTMPDECIGLKAPFVYVYWLDNSFDGKMAGPVDVVLRALTFIFKDAQECADCGEEFSFSYCKSCM
jgi:hypothetical protein